MGPNDRVWGDDLFWMDVLIQGVGWLLVILTIRVSINQFTKTQKKAAAAEELARKKAGLLGAADALGNLLDELQNQMGTGDWTVLKVNSLLTRHSVRLALANVSTEPDTDERGLISALLVTMKSLMTTNAAISAGTKTADDAMVYTQAILTGAMTAAFAVTAKANALA